MDDKTKQRASLAEMAELKCTCGVSKEEIIRKKRISGRSGTNYRQNEAAIVAVEINVEEKRRRKDRSKDGWTE